MLHRTVRFTGHSLLWRHQDVGRKCWVIGRWHMESCPINHQPLSQWRTQIWRATTTVVVKLDLPHHAIKFLRPPLLLLCRVLLLSRLLSLQVPHPLLCPWLLYSFLLSIHCPATSQLLVMMLCLRPIWAFRPDRCVIKVSSIAPYPSQGEEPKPTNWLFVGIV